MFDLHLRMKLCQLAIHLLMWHLWPSRAMIEGRQLLKQALEAMLAWWLPQIQDPPKQSIPAGSMDKDAMPSAESLRFVVCSLQLKPSGLSGKASKNVSSSSCAEVVLVMVECVGP